MADQNQTATIETSKKYSVNLPDFLRSSVTSLLTALAAVVLQFIDAWTSNPISVAFDKVSFLTALKVAIAAWIGDLIRRYFKPSATVIKIAPPIKKVNDDDPPPTGGDGSGVENPKKPGTP